MITCHLTSMLKRADGLHAFKFYMSVLDREDTYIHNSVKWNDVSWHISPFHFDYDWEEVYSYEGRKP